MLRVSADNDFDPEESVTYKAIMSKCLSNLIASKDESEGSWNLRGCKFGDADALTIVKGLEGNTTVTELDLFDNCFTEVGLQAIAKMMEGNSTVITVDLGGNSGVDEKDSAACKEIKLKCRQNLVSCVCACVCVRVFMCPVS